MPSPRPSSPAPGHFYGYHGYHAPCTTELETVTKKLCRIEVERECETKTKTFVKVTGYEDTDCKEVELKRPVHHGYLYHKREAEDSGIEKREAGRGYGRKPSCKRVPK